MMTCEIDMFILQRCAMEERVFLSDPYWFGECVHSRRSRAGAPGT